MLAAAVVQAGGPSLFREHHAAPSVSAIIPAYNAAPFLEGALESAVAEAGPDGEVIVVDDGSTDDTPALLARWAPRVRAIRIPNGGPGRARNAGIAESRAPLIAFLDADDRWTPGSLAARRRRLAAAPEAALVHGAVRYVDGQGRPMAFDAMAYAARRGLAEGRVLRALFRHNFIHTSTVVVRRSALEAVGGFDERREVIEDYDLWLRLAARHSIVFAPETAAVYRWREGSLGKALDRAYLGQVAPLEAAVARGGLARTPLGRSLVRRRRLARLYADYAHDLLRFHGDAARARAALGRSLRLVPFAPRRAAVWAAACLGPAELAAARRALRRLRGLRARLAWGRP